jgi:hypothetical protein
LTLHQALVRARKRYPDFRLGQLIYEAVVLSHPDVGSSRTLTDAKGVKQKAKVADVIYSLTDADLETALNHMDKDIRKIE